MLDKILKFKDVANPYSLTDLLEKLNLKIFGKAWIDRTVMFGWDPIFLAAGAMTGLRVSISMMLGGTLCWAVFVPIMQQLRRHHPRADGEPAFRDIVQWTLWGGAACMVTSGLFSFAMQWRSMLRAIASLRKLFSRGEANA